VRTDGRTDEYDEANSWFSQFQKRAYKGWFMPRSTLHSVGNDIALVGNDIALVEETVLI
jgi:hypothetical protein